MPASQGGLEDFSRFLRRWLPVAIWMVIILVASTDLGSSGTSFRLLKPILRWFDPQMPISEIYAANILFRKISHVVEFAILAMLVWRTRDLLKSPWRKSGSLRLTGLVLLVAAFFAVSTELVQYAARDRAASPWDVLINLAGACLGLAVIFSVKWARLARTAAPPPHPPHRRGESGNRGRSATRRTELPWLFGGQERLPLREGCFIERTTQPANTMDVRMIAHDMRTPLNALSLSLRSARMLGGDPSGLASTLDLAERNVRALSSMVETLLATKEPGPWASGELALRECLPLELVADAVDQVAPMAAEKKQHLKTGELQALPPLVADPNRLVRVLVNLLSNAVKFTPQGGRIEVSAKVRVNDGHRVMVFSVSDDGAGIPPEQVEQIFVEGVSIAKGGNDSNGLGLAVCREIVEAHGGRIWVEAGRMRGAKLSFSVPADLPPAG